MKKQRKNDLVHGNALTERVWRLRKCTWAKEIHVPEKGRRSLARLNLEKGNASARQRIFIAQVQ
jgi:hypothetical protein